MNYIKVDKNPWLQYETKIPLREVSLSMIQATMNDFLHKHGVLLHKVVFGLPDDNGVFTITNIDNGAIIARCTLQIVTPKV